MLVCDFNLLLKTLLLYSQLAHAILDQLLLSHLLLEGHLLLELVGSFLISDELMLWREGVNGQRAQTQEVVCQLQVSYFLSA